MPPSPPFPLALRFPRETSGTARPHAPTPDDPEAPRHALQDPHARTPAGGRPAAAPAQRDAAADPGALRDPPERPPHLLDGGAHPASGPRATRARLPARPWNWRSRRCGTLYPQTHRRTPPRRRRHCPSTRRWHPCAVPRRPPSRLPRRCRRVPVLHAHPGAPLSVPRLRRPTRSGHRWPGPASTARHDSATLAGARKLRSRVC